MSDQLPLRCCRGEKAVLGDSVVHFIRTWSRRLRQGDKYSLADVHGYISSEGINFWVTVFAHSTSTRDTISHSNDTLNYTSFLLAYSLQSLLPNGEQAKQLRAEN
jgi:hypothetical protein